MSGDVMMLQKFFILATGRAASSAELGWLAGLLGNGSWQTLYALVNSYMEGVSAQKGKAAAVKMIAHQGLGLTLSDADAAWVAQQIGPGRLWPTWSDVFSWCANNTDSFGQTLSNRAEAANAFIAALDTAGKSNFYDGEAEIKVRSLLQSIDNRGDSLVEAKSKLDSLVASLGNTPAYIWKSYSGFDGAVASDHNVFLIKDVWTNWQTGRKDDIVVSRLNSDLNISKTAYVGDAYDQYFTAGAATHDGGLVIVGSYRDQSSSDMDSFIVKLDANLNVVKTIKVGAAGTGSDQIEAVAVRPDGKIVVVGWEYSVADAKDAYILLLDSDLNVVAQKRVDNAAIQNSNEQFIGVTVLQDNTILANAGEGTIVKFDQNLNLVRSVKFSDNIREIVQAKNGKIFLKNNGHYLYQVNDDLSVIKAWSAKDGSIFGLYMWDIVAHGDYLVAQKDRYADLLQIDVSGGSPVIVNREYVTDRHGNNIYPDDIISFKDLVLFFDNGNSVSSVFSLKPSETVSPNLAGDYRVYEGDFSGMTFVEQVVSKVISQTPLNYMAADINIIGTLNFTVMDGTGSMVVNGGDSLIA